MKFLVDMNMSPRWADFLKSSSFEALHWSSIGRANAPDTSILEYARTHGYTVLTEDLDFGNLLALTNCESPSVLQIRVQISTPERLGLQVLAAIQRFMPELERGALVTINSRGHRHRVLPFRPIE